MPVWWPSTMNFVIKVSIQVETFLTFLRANHFFPVEMSKPVPSHFSMKSYSSDLVISFWLPRMNSASLGSVKRTIGVGPIRSRRVLPYCLTNNSTVLSCCGGDFRRNNSAVPKSGRHGGPGSFLASLWHSWYVLKYHAIKPKIKATTNVNNSIFDLIPSNIATQLNHALNKILRINEFWRRKLSIFEVHVCDADKKSRAKDYEIFTNQHDLTKQ